MALDCLEFEKPIAELQEKIEALKSVGSDQEINIQEEIDRLESKSKQLAQKIFKSLTDRQIVQLARHPKRPHSRDYIETIFTDFQVLHGDRLYADNPALIAGIGRLEGRSVMILGQQKGRETNEKIKRNSGMMHPEGYRKALRLMRLAEQYALPVITLIDTPGAYPGVGAESRGQSEAIAKNLLAMSELKVPILAVIIGEGCSGGALGLGVADRTLMLEYAYYATISPEGCATILWKNADKAAEAAEIMNLTAPKLKKLNLIHEIIPEPLGGAHRNPAMVSHQIKLCLQRNLSILEAIPIEKLVEQRYAHYLQIGLTAQD